MAEIKHLSKVIRILKWIGHGLFILVMLGFPYYVFYETRGPKNPGNPASSPFLWWFSFSFLALFYGYTYYIIPRTILKKKYLAFVGAVILLFLVFFFGRPFEFFFDDVLYRRHGRPHPPYDWSSVDILSLVMFGMLMALGLSIQIVKQWQKTEMKAIQADVDKANAELSALKMQIHPHFIFNALNAIYALIRTNNPLAGDAVLKLSSIMRYVTDYASLDYVYIKDEIASLTDYVNLQRLQHCDKVQVDCKARGEYEGKQLAPLILLTYIENAFKYGISNHEPAPITIRINIEGDKLEFFCQNRIFSTPRVTERTGVGLQNTKKRLDFLYPGKYSLNIDSNNELYTVRLTLLLS